MTKNRNKITWERVIDSTARVTILVLAGMKAGDLIELLPGGGPPPKVESGLDRLSRITDVGNLAGPVMLRKGVACPGGPDAQPLPPNVQVVAQEYPTDSGGNAPKITIDHVLRYAYAGKTAAWCGTAVVGASSGFTGPPEGTVVVIPNTMLNCPPVSPTASLCPPNQPYENLPFATSPEAASPSPR